MFATKKETAGDGREPFSKIAAKHAVIPAGS
jgi:hypothetical protein